MHLGSRSTWRRRAEPEGVESEKKRTAVLRKLAGHYGESWWQEVLLLFVAMSKPSMFGPLMRRW